MKRLTAILALLGCLLLQSCAFTGAIMSIANRQTVRDSSAPSDALFPDRR